MRKSSAKTTFYYYFEWIEWYSDFVNKVYAARRVVGKKDEKKEIFEAVAFKLHAIWHILAEDLLIDCLNLNSSQYATHMDIRLPKNLSRPQCEAMIYGLGYVDFKGVGHIKSIAKDILVPENNPFKVIEKSTSNKIDEFYRIRNYLAHYSTAARRSLNAMYKQSYNLKRFREPGDFLIAFDNSAGQTRLGNYLDAFYEAGEDMAKFLKII